MSGQACHECLRARRSSLIRTMDSSLAGADPPPRCAPADRTAPDHSLAGVQGDQTTLARRSPRRRAEHSSQAPRACPILALARIAIQSSVQLCENTLYVQTTINVRTNFEFFDQPLRSGFVYTRSTDMPDDPTLPPKLSRVELRIAHADLRTWREAAVRAKQKLSDWIRRACDERIASERKK